MKASLKRQRGITLTRLIVVGLLLVLVVIGAMRILPDVTDYYTILKDAKATARDPDLRNAPAAEVRKAFDRRIQIDSVTDISGSDLDISRDGNGIAIAFAYTKKIRLAPHVSLVIDFEGNTSGAK